MIERYQGDEGRGLLKAALASQPLFGSDETLIEEFISELELIELSLDDVLIGNGRGERDLFVIIQGKLGVVVDGQVVVSREKGDYVGELSLIDSATKRQATVTAQDTTVVGRVSEPSFSALADKYPVLWRNLAIEMVRRVTEQG